MNFTLPSTSKRIITIVVATLSICAIVTISALSAVLITGSKPDTALLTAYVGIATASLAGLTGLLANTRTTPGTDTEMPKASITTIATDQPTTITTDKPST